MPLSIKKNHADAMALRRIDLISLREDREVAGAYSAPRRTKLRSRKPSSHNAPK
jgi:hypothetical protein